MDLLLLATNTIPCTNRSLLLQRVRLHFLFFELEQCSKCVCDSLDIAMVEEKRTPMTYSFCGNTIPDDVSTGTNTVLVYFRTDGSTSRSGFRIYYSDILPAQGNANMCLMIYVATKYIYIVNITSRDAQPKSLFDRWNQKMLILIYNAHFKLINSN